MFLETKTQQCWAQGSIFQVTSKQTYFGFAGFFLTIDERQQLVLVKNHPQSHSVLPAGFFSRICHEDPNDPTIPIGNSDHFLWVSWTSLLKHLSHVQSKFWARTFKTFGRSPSLKERLQQQQKRPKKQRGRNEPLLAALTCIERSLQGGMPVDLSIDDRWCFGWGGHPQYMFFLERNNGSNCRFMFFFGGESTTISEY